MGDGDYMFAFQQVVMPIACEFDPDLVPTVGQLLRELDAVGSEPAGEEHSGLSFSNRMMPMVNQRSHHFRLGKNLVEAIC